VGFNRSCFFEQGGEYMLEDYEINSSTIAIISVKKGCSKIIEEDEAFFVTKDATEIISDSCKYFGSSYSGRFEGTKSLIGVNYKAPIIIEESMEIIFFPTSSPRFANCNWICLKKINNIQKNDKKTVLNFKNGSSLVLDVSYSSIENQILRSSLLESKMRNRKIDSFNKHFN
jgi:competence protein ComK